MNHLRLCWVADDVFYLDKRAFDAGAQLSIVPRKGRYFIQVLALHNGKRVKLTRMVDRQTLEILRDDPEVRPAVRHCCRHALAGVEAAIRLVSGEHLRDLLEEIFAERVPFERVNVE